jgi:DNA mismatch repair protein MSH4
MLTDVCSADVLGDRLGVLNLHLATESSITEENIPKTTMLYKVTQGRMIEEHYGLSLAAAMGFPARFMEVAGNVAKMLYEQREAKKQGSQTQKLVTRRKLIINLYELLRQVAGSDMDEPALASYLLQVRKEFVEHMSALDENGTDRSFDEHIVESVESEMDGYAEGNA